MARTWFWNFNEAEFDPDTGAYLQSSHYIYAAAPRFPGDPTDLTHLTCVEDINGAFGAFAMNDVPYASQAALITAFNETQIERLQLEPEPAA